MYCNFRYGDESLRTINTYLWATYIYVFVAIFVCIWSLDG